MRASPQTQPRLPRSEGVTVLALALGLAAIVLLAVPLAACHEPDSTSSQATHSVAKDTTATSLASVTVPGSSAAARAGAGGEGGAGTVQDGPPPPSASVLASAKPQASQAAKTAPAASSQTPEPDPGAKPDPNDWPSLKPAPTPTPAPTPAPTETAKPEPTGQPTPKPPPLSPPEPGSADALAQKLDDIYRPIRIFRARFKQQFKVKVSGVTKESQGVVMVKRPESLSFRYDPPNSNRVVSDGSELKVYEHSNQQMFIKPVSHTQYPGALAFIMGKPLRESFTFEFHKAASAKFEGGKVLVGTPKVPNPGYTQVLFYIDETLLAQGDPRAIRRVLVLDAQGNKNRFDFTSITQPDSVPDSEFRFTPPKGTEIIK